MDQQQQQQQQQQQHERRNYMMIHATKTQGFLKHLQKSPNKTNAELRGHWDDQSRTVRERVVLADLDLRPFRRNQPSHASEIFSLKHTQRPINMKYLPIHAYIYASCFLNCKIGRSYIECVGDEVSKHLRNSYYSV